MLPGGNLGNVVGVRQGSARVARRRVSFDRLPRLAVIQAGRLGSVLRLHAARQARRSSARSRSPETLATAIKIGDPVSWPKAQHEIETTNGVVEKVTEQEIADAKAQIGRAGIGCEPASAATLAGIRKTDGSGVISRATPMWSRCLPATC